MVLSINTTTQKKLLCYLYDHLDKDQLEIDTVNFSYPSFCQCGQSFDEFTIG